MKNSSKISLPATAIVLAFFLSVPASLFAADPPAPAKAAPAAAPAKAAGVGISDAKTPAAPAAPRRKESTNPKLDPLLKKALDEMKYNYDVNADGVCKMVFDLSGKQRSHQIFVNSEREFFIGVGFRKVWATAMKSKDVPPADVLKDLLRDSAFKKIGAWELGKWPDGYRVILCAKVPADCSTAVLQAAIKLVLNGADLMEEKLTGKDAF